MSQNSRPLFSWLFVGRSWWIQHHPSRKFRHKSCAIWVSRLALCGAWLFPKVAKVTHQASLRYFRIHRSIKNSDFLEEFDTRTVWVTVARVILPLYCQLTVDMLICFVDFTTFSYFFSTKMVLYQFQHTEPNNKNHWKKSVHKGNNHHWESSTTESMPWSDSPMLTTSWTIFCSWTWNIGGRVQLCFINM